VPVNVLQTLRREDLDLGGERKADPEPDEDQ